MKKQTTLKQDLEKCLLYCKEQNGLPYCKNCGLDESMLNKVDSIIDEIISEVNELQRVNFWAFLEERRGEYIKLEDVTAIINNKKQV